MFLAPARLETPQRLNELRRVTHKPQSLSNRFTWARYIPKLAQPNDCFFFESKLNQQILHARVRPQRIVYRPFQAECVNFLAIRRQPLEKGFKFRKTNIFWPGILAQVPYWRSRCAWTTRMKMHVWTHSKTQCTGTQTIYPIKHASQSRRFFPISGHPNVRKRCVVLFQRTLFITTKLNENQCNCLITMS